MADTYQRIFKSDLFTFLVGEDKKPIVVHSAAITEQSKALSALINNGMAESQTRSATLGDVDEDDFIRFCQFAYTGDYSTPPFTKDVAPVPSTSNESEQISVSIEPPDDELPPSPPRSELTWDSEGWGFGSLSSTKKSKKKYKSTKAAPVAVKKSVQVWQSWGVDVSQVNYQDLRTLQTNFENRQICQNFPRQYLLDSCEPQSNTKDNHNFTPVFLAHSHLYVFADKYGIEPLQQLALQKLHQTLVRFELYPARVDDLVTLVRYVYSDDHTFGDGADELRALVAVYMASRINKLNQFDSFLTLLEEGGAFVRDFWLLVRNALYV